MKAIIVTLFVILIGYACGNIHGAFLLGKLSKNIDIREHGSGNSGSTNALRVLGLKGAVPAFLIDFFKSFLPVFYINSILAAFGLETASWNELIIFQILVAIAAIIGHNYPVVLKFKGGKGMASTIGVLFAIDYRCGIIFAISMITIIAVTKYVSLASIISAVIIPYLFYIIRYDVKPLFWFGTFLMVSAIYRHKENIVRLVNGNERKIGQKVKVD